MYKSSELSLQRIGRRLNKLIKLENSHCGIAERIVLADRAKDQLMCEIKNALIIAENSDVKN